MVSHGAGTLSRSHPKQAPLARLGYSPFKLFSWGDSNHQHPASHAEFPILGQEIKLFTTHEGSAPSSSAGQADILASELMGLKLLVGGPGIEPGSQCLQHRAHMTTLAHHPGNKCQS